MIFSLKGGPRNENNHIIDNILSILVLLIIIGFEDLFLKTHKILFEYIYIYIYSYMHPVLIAKNVNF